MTTPTLSKAETIAKAIYESKFHFNEEKDLQRGIAQVLTQLKFEFKAEVPLTRGDRLDFLVGDVAIEVKVDSSTSSVTRQLWRYAKLPEVNHLILVTTRSKHKNMPDEMNGKPLYVVYLLNSFL
jgi:hypothetical protein